MPYSQALRLMEKVESYKSIEEKIDPETREALFKEHMSALFGKRAKDFRDLLDESHLTPDSRWEIVRENLREDERYQKFPERNRQHCFQQHREFLGKKVKREFMLFMGDMATQMQI